MQSSSKYGKLLGSDIKIHRKYFKEMVELIGVVVMYMSPRPNKHWTTYAEIKSNYNDPQEEGCIFNEHPDQKTMKKLGWVSELQEGASIISVRYDLENLQVGSLFTIPSGIDTAKDRLFRVVELSTMMIYPASVTCMIVPEYEDTFDNSLFDHSSNSFNLLNREADNL